ncbi:hypothetical protein DRO54_06815 [Candidatus Bathyarchaeota archaeon]|nr:MAG: hypothetical protein DRO54_06815 [Candidatus Bathyarchaeota archaeon]
MDVCKFVDEIEEKNGWVDRELFEESIKFLRHIGSTLGLDLRVEEGETLSGCKYRSYYFPISDYFRYRIATEWHCVEDGTTVDRYTIHHDGLLFIKHYCEDYPKLLSLAEKIVEAWSRVTDDDVIYAHRPFSKDVEFISTATSMFYPYDKIKDRIAKLALSKVGIRGFISKRFRGGDWLFVKIRSDGTVYVSKSKPSWVIGYLIGKGGHRARSLGIRVKVV